MGTMMNFKKFSVLIAAFLVVVGIYRYIQPLPPIPAMTTISPPSIGAAAGLPWPSYGQAAIGAQDYGLLATSGEQKPVPMASITKVVTALAVLRQKPLEKGQQGPTIIINKDDVATYNSYYLQDGSVVKVTDGESISEYQALQALLIPSANNMADTLARWAFGSVENYVTYASKMLAGMDLNQTKVADASGFSPSSLSSAKDLVTLGEAAMSNQVLSEIVAQQSVTLPVAGTINNFNWLLGSDGVVGIKTGNTDQAGGCYLFASKRVVNGQSVTVIGAIMSAPDRNKAISDSRTILQSIDNSFELAAIARKDEVVGYYQTPWGAKANIVAKEDLTILAWKGTDLKMDKQIEVVKAPAASGKQIGKITVSSAGKSKDLLVVLKNDLSGPPWTWRLFR